MFPSIILPGSSISRMTDSAVTDLPQPVSPTTPRRSPWFIQSSTPLSALTCPAYVSKTTFRPEISSKSPLRRCIVIS
jgi:hypothetical protein